jgi:hypothetical protein
VNYKTWSYRFADQVLNSNWRIKSEIESTIDEVTLPEGEYKRPAFNKLFEDAFISKGWKRQFRLFEDKDVESDEEVPLSKIDFIKERVGVEVAFTHSSFLGTELLKFQTLSYANLDKIDVGVYIVATNALHKATGKAFDGTIMFEKVVKYLPHFKSAIQVPVWVVGLLP